MDFETPRDLSAFVLLHVMKTFREQGREGLAPKQVVGLLRERWQFPSNRQWYDMRLEPLVEMLLHDLVELGWLVVGEGRDSPLYRIAMPPSGATPPPELPRAETDGDPPEGGSGMAEVLAHPILFAYPPEAFEEALTRALEPQT